MFDYKTVKGIPYSFSNVWWYLQSTKLEYLTFITISGTFIHDSIHLKTTRGLLGYNDNFGGKWSKFGELSFVANKKKVKIFSKIMFLPINLFLYMSYLLQEHCWKLIP